MLKNQKRRILSALLFGLLFSSCVFAQESEKKPVSISVNQPSIRLLSPFDNEMTSRSKVLFKGLVKGVKTLNVGDIEVKVDQEGKFFHRHFLPLENAYNHVKITGITNEGKTITKTVRIFRIHKEFESDRLDAALDAIHAAYESLGWKKRPLDYEVRRYLSDQLLIALKKNGTLSVRNILEEAPQIEIMLQYAELLRRDQTALILIPWAGTSPFLEAVTHELIRIVDHMTLMSLKNFGILYFNRELSILENYSSRQHIDNPLVVKKWILNDENLANIGTIPEPYNQFISQRFIVDYTRVPERHDPVANTKPDIKKEHITAYHKSELYKKALSLAGKDYYLVIVGTFASHVNCNVVMKELKREGYESDTVPFYTREGDILYRVQLGHYQTKKEAKAIERQLRKIGFDTFLVRT